MLARERQRRRAAQIPSTENPVATRAFAQSKDGVKLRYEVRGQGEPLALVFGYSGSGRGWGEPFLRLLEARFKLLVIDNRGTGESDKPERPFTIADMADDVGAVLDHAAVERTHLMGISMGGMIAQEFALRHPQRLRGLVLGCTLCGFAHGVAGDPETLAALQVKPEQPLEQQIEKLLAACCAKSFLASARGQEVLRARLAEIMNYPMTPLHTFALQWQAIGGFDTYERLGQIKAPTLVVTGTADLLVPDRNSEIIAERIPGARLHKIAGAGHVFFWEQPEQSAEAAVKFLSAAH